MPENLTISSSIEKGDRETIYGGWFDLVNVLSPWKQSLEALKFASLFYKRVVVPDGFFHCYGPLFWQLETEAKDAEFKIHSPEENNKFPILASLREGIIVPALRAGSSIHDTWRSGKSGVVPGEYTIVAKKPGDKVLGLIDKSIKYYIDWPESLTPKIKNQTSRFASAVSDLFLNEKSPYCVTQSDMPENLPHGLSKDLMSARDLLDGFAGVLHDADGNAEFRRGHVEKYLGEKLGIKVTSYLDLVTRVDWKNPYRTFKESYSYFIASVASSAYELEQASAFNAVAALFPLHDDPIIEEQGLHCALRKFPSSSPHSRNKPLLFGSLDVSRMPIQEIFNFRRKDIFYKYLEHLTGILTPNPGESFWEVNSDFVEFVRNNYVPAIIENFPSAGHISTASATAGNTLLLAGASTSIFAESLEVAGVPLFRLLMGGGIVLNTIALAPRIHAYIRNKRTRREFRKNNYAFWSATTTAVDAGGGVQ